MTVFALHSETIRHGLDSLSVLVNPNSGALSEQPLVSLIDGLVFISVLVRDGVAFRRRSSAAL